jgi:hypothetical protein
MSMPQFLTVAVISCKDKLKANRFFSGEKASTIAAILKGKNAENMLSPRFLPIAHSECRVSLVKFGISKGFIVSHNPAYPRLINPKEINIWLALDREGELAAQERIKQGGFSRNEFYQAVFPKVVMRCGFPVPDPPIEDDFQDWFNLLVEKFEPWKQRIWNAFCQSS